jgi:glycosyltransferase involved in cell wall biosynthesis
LYVIDALTSAVNQTCAADEIIVVDDASSDGTSSIIEKYLGEHPAARIRYIRNEKNIGLTASFAKAAAMAGGDVLITMAGDDVSDPRRVNFTLRHFLVNPKSMALITNACIIDGESRPVGTLDNCAGQAALESLSLDDLEPGSYFLKGRSACGAAAAYRAQVFRAFSPLKSGLFGEDEPAAFRAMMLGTCDFMPEFLVSWRRHEKNLSNGGGVNLEPGIAAHFRRSEAMVDQMLADADEWLSKSAKKAPPGFLHAVSRLRFQKAKWALWAAAHERGLSIAAFISAFASMASSSPKPLLLIQQTWRPFFKMVMPFTLQRAIRKFRSAK